MHYTPNTPDDVKQMLTAIGEDSVSCLFEDIPSRVRSPKLNLPGPLSEMQLQRELATLAGRNATGSDYACFLGAGAYRHYIPSVVRHVTGRSEFYTAYTPYQPEISQGTLQAIFEYQTAVCELAGMEVANASLYDGASAVAGAIKLAVGATRRRRVVVAPTLNPEYLAVARTYCGEDGATLTADWDQGAARSQGRLDLGAARGELDGDTACLVVQQPNFLGVLEDVAGLAEAAHEVGALLVVAADPVSLGLLQPPGQQGADVVVGEGQALGNPLSFGGPYLGLFATRERYVRQMPGRVVGQTVDSRGQVAYTLTLQTREQHIRREKATSNICSNEALCALAALVYLAAMGKNGLRRVAELCTQKAHYLAERIAALPGFAPAYPGVPFYQEFAVRCPRPAAEVNAELLRRRIIGGYDLGRYSASLGDCLLFCVTETNTRAEIDRLIDVLGEMSEGVSQ